MITRTQAYVTSDNQTFADLNAAIGHELGIVLNIDAEAVIQALLTNRDKVIDLLTTTPSSKAKARRVNGGTKKRTPKPAGNAPELPGTK